MKFIEDGYLALNNLEHEDPLCDAGVQNLLKHSHEVSKKDVRNLLLGASWRERLTGLLVTAATDPKNYTSTLIESLHQPRGLALIPTCACLCLSLKDEPVTNHESELQKLEREVFSRDLGWALDKLYYHLGWSVIDPGGTSPNDSKNFEKCLKFYQQLGST